jgi:hypothetical protein
MEITAIPVSIFREIIVYRMIKRKGNKDNKGKLGTDDINVIRRIGPLLHIEHHLESTHMNRILKRSLLI